VFVHGKHIQPNLIVRVEHITVNNFKGRLTHKYYTRKQNFEWEKDTLAYWSNVYTCENEVL
jgi:hypothetical protein